MAVDPARAKSLFLAASDLSDPAERAAYLERECGADAELRQRVEALLAADDGGGRPVEGDAGATSEPTSPATQEATAAVDAETRLPSEPATAEDRSDGADFTLAVAPQADRPGGSGVGQVIAGRYTLLEVLGEGGMGTVYRAGQTQPVKRQVALKLIKVGMDSRAVLARFDAERQALALMDHPNIARVYDGGTTEAGQPFFVMELVSGEPITEYCDRLRLPVRARLELFVAVCQAVQHAHQKGIIHRDLKPSNVMVTEVDGRPAPKVIDFGVAKATEFSLTDQSLGDTGAIVGTPTYMSPEQADPTSMDIDTRTDVYALGVILYELLVGSPPIDAKQFKRGAILEMLRMVREVDPPKPSTKVSTSDALPSISANRDIEPAHLKRALQGDLDWIVMRALEKDRTRRYETANGFAADIQRHLAHEPVVAAPPSRAYRLRKFVRKHRGAVIAASLVLLTLLGGLAAVAAVQTVANARLAASLTRETNANAALNEANGQLTKSRAAVQARYELATDAIKTFHTGVSEDFLLKEEKFKDLRNRLLKSASDFYGKLGALLGKETDLASRRALAQANFELSDLTDKVGRTEDALAAHRQVLAAREALASEPGADAWVKADVARSLFAIAVLLEATGKVGEAEGAYRRSESLLADLAPADASARAVLAAGRSELGYLLCKSRKYNDALATLVRARADQEALAAAPGASVDARRDLASTINRIGIVLQIDKPAEAEAAYRAALDLRRKLAKDYPAIAEYRSSVAQAQLNLGGLLMNKMHKSTEAEVEYRAALALYLKLTEDYPAVTYFRSRSADAHSDMFLLLWRSGRLEEAEVEARAVLAIKQKLADEHPARTDYRGDLANSHTLMSIVLQGMGKSAEEESESRAALAIAQKLAEDHPAVTRFWSRLESYHGNLGKKLSGMGRPAEAEAEERAALAIAQKLADEHPSDTVLRLDLAIFHHRLGDLLLKAGRLAEAETEYRKALALYQKVVDVAPANASRRSRLASDHKAIGTLFLHAGKPAEAWAEYRTALSILRKLADDNPGRAEFRSELADYHLDIGWNSLQAGNPSDAEAESRAALEIYRKLAEDDPRNAYYRDRVADSDGQLSIALRRLGRIAEAREHSERAVAVRTALVKEEPRNSNYRGSLAENYFNRGLARRALGDPAGAAADARRSLELYAAKRSRSDKQWFFSACLNAALAGLSSQAGSGVSAAEGDEAAARAIGMLHKAVGMGYRSAGVFRTEDALDPLRGRDDFRLLLLDLGFPADPFAR
jgi:eukaryotic-like serine/threonine-protein kinase